ncbi:hypothetical protein GALMADRAFT_231531 [Galerina marginata CBS 339.88]|uniref:Uncharacterized protein n=1 Tax=Galerina marginata (strain CBS 339.88) TaxID=685588 RepID=A0A067SB90_GALM3|nr:hypothetical protein GALMADRAFT_231531 [Galerina marginata CBS 339.88]
MGTMNVSQLNYVADLCESALTTRKMPIIHKVMFGASIVMWILGTLHLGLLIQRLSFGKTTLWEAKGAVSIATLQFMISDLILIWRVYAVWGRNYWPTVIPVILMIAAAAVRFSVVANGSAVLSFVSDPANDIIIANTMYCTALIAGRIWYIQWKTRETLQITAATGRRNVYQGVLLMIIESGALYALSQLISVIVDKVHSPGIHVILDITIPWTGILPTLIVLLVHFDLVPGTRASEPSNSATIATINEFHAASAPGATDDYSNTEGTGSRRTPSTLKTEGSDVEIHEKYNRSIV